MKQILDIFTYSNDDKTKLNASYNIASSSLNISAYTNVPSELAHQLIRKTELDSFHTMSLEKQLCFYFLELNYI